MVEAVRWFVLFAWRNGSSGESCALGAAKKITYHDPCFLGRHKNGLAVPVVDEIAAIPLDLWAQGRGYSKLQVNLMQA